MSFKKIIGGAGFLLIVASTGSAWANTAANTRITNAADLTYNDGTGVKHATSQVTVSVALKPSAPTITAGGSQTGSFPTALTDDFIITNNSNGPDTFTLAATTGNLVNLGSATATPTAGSITLGATVTVSGSYTSGGITYLIVPSDGTADSIINGIALNDKVVVNGDERTVSSIQDNATGTSIIQVPALSSAPGAGYVIGQRVTIHASATPGSITVAGQNVSFDVTMKATSSADAAIFASSGVVGNVFYSGSANLIKYVRNVTNPNGSGGSTITVNSVTYYNNPGSLTAKPGETLEYLLMATDASTSADVTGVTLTDLVPVDFVNLVTTAYSGKAFRYYPDNSSTSYLEFTSTGGDDAVDWDPTFDATVNAAKGKITAWIGGATPAYNTPGSINAGKSVMLLYQVTVKP